MSTYELRVYMGRDPETKKERVATRTFHGGARRADAALRVFIAELEEAGDIDTKATVRGLLSRWLIHVERLDHSPTTLREYRRIITKTIDPAIGSIELRKLTAINLDHLYGSLTDRGLSPASVRQVHSILRAALNQAVKWGQVPTSVVAKASPPPLRQKNVQAPSVADVQALLRYAEKDDPELACLIVLAALTGARRGELCAFRWGDVDWERQTLTISRSLATMGRRHQVVKATKTHAARTVALDEVAVAALHRQRARVAELAEDKGVEIGPDAPLISYDLSTPFHQTQLPTT